MIPRTNANCAQSLSEITPPLSEAVAEDAADAKDAMVPAVVLALTVGMLEEPDIDVSVCKRVTLLIDPGLVMPVDVELRVISTHQTRMVCSTHRGACLFSCTLGTSPELGSRCVALKSATAV